MAEPESLTPRASVEFGEVLHPVTSPKKQHRASVAKRLSGRPALNSASSLAGLENLGSATTKMDAQLSDYSDRNTDSTLKHRHSRHNHTNNIISQVRHWLHEEKARKASRQHKTRDGASKLANAVDTISVLAERAQGHGLPHRKGHHRRTSSASSDGTLALEKLEQILATSMDLHQDPVQEEKRRPYCSRKASRLLRKQSTIASSDTECHDSEPHVPSADVILDNSKTLGYSGGEAASQTSLPDLGKPVKKEKEAWLQFKYEIVRLTHTLKLTRWRRVPLERSGDIEVERLSGALTNAVYVVSPPVDLPQEASDPRDSILSVVAATKRPPPYVYFMNDIISANSLQEAASSYIRTPGRAPD